MEALAYNSIVAYWVDPIDYNQIRNRSWDKVQHYLLLEPTDASKKTYNAIKYKHGVYGGNRVRIQLEVPGDGVLMIEEDYNKQYAMAAEKIEQRKIWHVLSH